MPSHERRAIDLLGRTGYGRLAASMRALPFVAPARHIVAEGQIVLRMHRGHGYHEACVGAVVAYGADNVSTTAPGDGQWTVQVIGTGETASPSAEEIDRFGPAPQVMDGDPFEPVYLRLTPQFVTTHSWENGLEQEFARMEDPATPPRLPGPRTSSEDSPGW